MHWGGKKSLGSLLEHQDAQQTERTRQTPFLANGAHVLSDETGITPDEWLEWGPPSDVLEFTRAQIFEKMLSLRDDERQRIGQELHDSAGQLLLSLQLSVALLRETEKDNGHEGLIDEIQDTARLIDQEIRSLAFLNHPMRMDSRGLPAALQALIGGFGKRTGCRVSFKVIGDQPSEDGNSSMALLRVAQEALVNIHRHAHASFVTAKLERQERSLELTIGDNGVGLPPRDQLAVNRGVGLDGMRFRIERLGGSFRIAKLKHGTRISARVPLAC